MAKWVIGALLAATAWAPMAQAQGGEWRERRGSQEPQRAERPAGERQGGGWRGGDRDPGGPAQVVQPQVQAQADGRAGGWRGNGDGGRGDGSRGDGGRGDGGRGDRFQGGGQPRGDWQRPQSQPTQQTQGFNGRDRNGDRRPDWSGGQRPGSAGFDGYNRDPRAGSAPVGRYDGRRFDPPRDDGRGRNDRGWNGGRRFDDRGGSWNRSWRHDNRFDWNQYRSYNRNAFRLPRYYAPFGWGYGYRRFSIGVSLSSSLWGQDYWIDDPWAYRLPEAYGSYRWVRYYNDALLVDLRSGVVVDTVYDIFWY